jgi:hypothetical protein
MLRLGLGLLALTIATGAEAQGRPSTTAMTCNQARQFVLARGAVVLGTGGMTYDRFVADRSHCEPTEIATNAHVPARDTPACFIGYRCKEPSGSPFWDED